MKVEDLEVEYEKLYSFEAADNFDEVGFCGTRIKISKDNFISLRRKEKRVYSREELKEIVERYLNYYTSTPSPVDTIDMWIKQNL